VNLDPVCQHDVPWLTYSVTGADPGATVTITWVDPADPASNVVQTDLPLSGKVLWPGTVLDSHGDPVEWPGWRPVGGVWVQGDEWDWVRPSVQVIVSVSGSGSLDAHMAGVMVRLGQSVSAEAPVDTPITVDYPPPTPACNADPANIAAHTPPPTNALPQAGADDGSSTIGLFILASTAGLLAVLFMLALRRGLRSE
jgi:hypothetical protein